jgi:hypothetical protein
MSTQLVPVGDIERMALAVAKSGLFGLKTPEQAMALMLVAQAEGLHPASAARDYHIIQGQPALRSDAMLARFQAAGGSVKWLHYTDETVTGVFSHPSGGSIEVTWDMARAKTAGLGQKDNWRKFPRQMLAARYISEGVKRVYPGVAVGTYTPEEVQDFEPRPERVVEGERVVPVADTPAVDPVTDCLSKIAASQSEADLEVVRLRIVDMKNAKRISDADADRLRQSFVNRKTSIAAAEKRKPKEDNAEWFDSYDGVKDEDAA